MIQDEPKKSSSDIAQGMEEGPKVNKHGQNSRSNKGDSSQASAGPTDNDQELDRKLREIFEPVLGEPIPPKLQDLLKRLGQKHKKE